MYQTVAHARHGPPLDPWVLCAELRGNLFRSLSNNLKTAYNRPADCFVGQKLSNCSPVLRDRR
jgi:hypothetical protein